MEVQQIMFEYATGKFFEEVSATARKLEACGMTEAALELRQSFYGATGGEVYGALGSALKLIIGDPRLPKEFIPEIHQKISLIDAAYDRNHQPRPFAQKVETR
jgi:hypothetical protein